MSCCKKLIRVSDSHYQHCIYRSFVGFFHSIVLMSMFCVGYAVLLITARTMEFRGLNDDEDVPRSNRVSLASNSNVRSPRSASVLTSNQTIELVIRSLEDINSETNKLQLRRKVSTLDFHISGNKSLVISQPIRNYVYDIISNISYNNNRDSNLTSHMILTLRTMFEVRLTQTLLNLLSPLRVSHSSPYVFY